MRHFITSIKIVRLYSKEWNMSFIKSLIEIIHSFHYFTEQVDEMADSLVFYESLRIESIEEKQILTKEYAGTT